MSRRLPITNCYIIAGPNGAGKTTFATEFLPRYAECRNFINPDVRRRFGRTLVNLFLLYRPLLDTLHFFDNSTETPRLVFRDEAGHTTVSDNRLYRLLERQVTPWKSPASRP